MAISMEKIEQQAPELVSLVKKAQFALSKYDLTGVSARVALVPDFSGSAAPLYSRGVMQSAAEKALAVASQFDDDGTIEVFPFHHDARYAGDLTLENYLGGIDRLTAGHRMGGTDYARAIAFVTNHYFGPSKAARRGLFARKAQPAASSELVYVIFLTDGETENEAAALAAARASSEHPIFFQTIGMGNPDNFEFIADKLNNHGGRVDNFGFFTHPDISKMPDMALLDGLLNEFPRALAAMRAAGTLV